MFERIHKFITSKQSVQRNTNAAPPWTSTNSGTFRAAFAEPNLTEEERRRVESLSDLRYRKIDNFRGLHTIVLSWMGYEMFKSLLDLWVYQELIARENPDSIIEVGTYKGGSALYLATMCDLVGFGEIVTIDIDATHDPIRPRHPRITYLTGSSIADEVINQIAKAAEGRRNVLVILDGDHRCEHVLQELRLYQRFIRPGGFLVVKDTNINGHPTYPEFGPGS
ncbi:CmcI family methyltransferase [Trinickia sp. YCB016]